MKGIKKRNNMKRENKNKKVTLKTKTYSTKNKSKASAKEAVEYMMKHYPNLMEKLKNS